MTSQPYSWITAFENENERLRAGGNRNPRVAALVPSCPTASASLARVSRRETRRGRARE